MDFKARDTGEKSVAPLEALFSSPASRTKITFPRYLYVLKSGCFFFPQKKKLRLGVRRLGPNCLLQKKYEHDDLASLFDFYVIIWVERIFLSTLKANVHQNEKLWMYKNFVQWVTQLTFLTGEFISFLFTYRAIFMLETKDGIEWMLESGPSKLWGTL